MPKVKYKAFSRPPTTSMPRNDEDDDFYYAPDDMNGVLNLTVYSPEPAWVDTGLLDENGAPLMRYEAGNPIGFIWPDDDSN